MISPGGETDDDDKEVTLVVPDSACAIDSVTNDSIQRIGRSFGWDVGKRPVRYAELPNFDEVLGAGTAVAHDRKPRRRWSTCSGERGNGDDLLSFR